MSKDFKILSFSIKQKLRPKVSSVYNKLLFNQGISLSELSAINWEKRKYLLHHAYETVPYYSRTFQSAGINPQDVKNKADWNKLPILTKEKIRDNFYDLISKNVSPNRLKPVTTGGSTGQPLRVLHDNDFPYETLGWRMLSWWGVHPGEDAAFCWRLARKSWESKLLNDLIWWPTKRVWIDAARITESAVLQFIREFNAIRPVYFQGYTGAIDFVANYILDNRLSVHSPKCVWGTSSPVSAAQRASIEKAFRAPLYDQYGCSEIYWLAAQCRERSGLHVFADARHIEFVDDYGVEVPTGKIGNVVVTDLENYGFPLIRYMNGDISNFLEEKCSCGLVLPLISPIKGRITDLVRSSDGSVVAGDYITTLFDDFPEAVRSFQLHQFVDYSITVFVVPGSNLSLTSSSIVEVGKRLKNSTGGNVDIRFELVDKIESDMGKTRYVISEVGKTNRIN